MTNLLWAVCVVCAVGAIYYGRQTALLSAMHRRLEASLRTAESKLQAETQRMTRELALLRFEHEALLDRCGVGVLVLDRIGTIESANITARLIFGPSPQGLVGKPILEATLSSDLKSLVYSARETMALQSREIRGSDLGGRALIVSISPVDYDEVGESRFLVVVRDVTDLRRLETIRRDFVANVSHELRTPLASIRAMAETLQDGALHDPKVAQRFLSTIVTEAQRLTRISEDLLILSRAESRLPEKTVFLISDLIEEIARRFQPQAEQAGITLECSATPELEVTANYDQIEQVVLNLVDNAIKYTPSGGRVCITTEQRHNSISIHVADTGIGIMRDDLPRIFERFYRVDKARSRQSGGTGLGLSIVKHIVESHGGQVTVESEFNHGSTFRFTLPLS